MPAVPELMQRVEAAQTYFSDCVESSGWDALADECNQPPLPAVEAVPAEERYAQAAVRHAGILDFTKRSLNLRELYARSGERWMLNYQDGHWAERTGVAGIDDPTSEASRRLLTIEEDFGLITPMRFSQDFQPGFLLALACAGPSVAQRIQTQYGLEVTPVTPDGSFKIERVEDEAAHQALRDPNVLRVSTASGRLLDRARGEDQEVRGFAPGAETEFDLTVAATRHMLGRGAQRQTFPLRDPGYAFKGKEGSIVVHAVKDEVRGVNVEVPLPTDAERGRAQTLHSYTAMTQALLFLADRGLVAPSVVAPGAQVGVVTNACYGLFQRTAAINASIEPGFVVEMTTYDAARTGIPRLNMQQHLSVLPEAHSFAVHLGFLRGHINHLLATT